MSWIIFYPLLGFYLYWMYRIAFKPLSLGQKTVLWVVTSIPVVAYCWGFFATQFDHYRACRDEAGLKVYVKPENADRVRLVGKEYISTGAEPRFLHEFYPRLRYVEVPVQKRSQQPVELMMFTGAPNPRSGAPLRSPPWKEPPYVFSSRHSQYSDARVHEISKVTTLGVNFMKIETRLSLDGVVLAKYTYLQHGWDGIRYPDAVPTWRCPDGKNSNSNFADPAMAEFYLIDLLLK